MEPRELVDFVELFKNVSRFEDELFFLQNIMTVVNMLILFHDQILNLYVFTDKNITWRQLLLVLFISISESFQKYDYNKPNITWLQNLADYLHVSPDVWNFVTRDRVHIFAAQITSVIVISMSNSLAYGVDSIYNAFLSPVLLLTLNTEGLRVRQISE